jgi:hypothetical protein
MINKDKTDAATERADFVSGGKSWLIDNGYLDNHLVFDDVILNLICCSKHIKNATLDIDNDRKKMRVNLYMPVFSFFIASKKKLAAKIQNILDPLAQYYEIETKFYRYREAAK